MPCRTPLGASSDETPRPRGCGHRHHGGRGRYSPRRPDTTTITRIPDPGAVRAAVPGRANLSAPMPAEHARLWVQVRTRLGDMAAGNRIALVHNSGRPVTPTSGLALEQLSRWLRA